MAKPVVLALSSLLWCGVAIAADVALPQDVRLAKRTTLELSLSSAEKDLCSLQLDLVFDSNAVNLFVDAGPAAISAGKGVVESSSELGRRRLIIAGLNQQPIRDGVLLRINVVLIAPLSEESAYAIGIQNAAGAGSDARAIQVTASGGSVIVDQRQK